MSSWFSPTSSRRSIARSSIVSSVSGSIGFSMKLCAPAFIASTALGTLAVPRHHDDLGGRVGLLELAQELQPVRIGQHHVRHDDVGLPGPEDLVAAGPDHRRPDLVALVLEQNLQPLDHRRLIVYGENAALFLR